MVAGQPGKLLVAARVAMALGYVGLVRNNRVSAAVIGAAGGPARLSPLRGRQNVQRLAGFLLDHAFAPPTIDQSAVPPARGGPGAAFTAACRAIAAGRQGKGVLVLLSDLLIPPPEGYQPGLRLLAAPSGAAGAGSSYDVICMQVLSPGEIDPAVEGRSGLPRTAGSETGADIEGPVLGDLALTDVETGRVADVTVTADLLKSYRAAVQRYIEEARGFCSTRGVTHMLLRSDIDVRGLVIDTLRHRGLLR
jgi:hypothetical protein